MAAAGVNHQAVQAVLAVVAVLAAHLIKPLQLQLEHTQLRLEQVAVAVLRNQLDQVQV